MELVIREADLADVFTHVATASPTALAPPYRLPTALFARVCVALNINPTEQELKQLFRAEDKCVGMDQMINVLSASGRIRVLERSGCTESGDTANTPASLNSQPSTTSAVDEEMLESALSDHPLCYHNWGEESEGLGEEEETHSTQSPSQKPRVNGRPTVGTRRANQREISRSGRSARSQSVTTRDGGHGDSAETNTHRERQGRYITSTAPSQSHTANSSTQGNTAAPTRMSRSHTEPSTTSPPTNATPTITSTPTSSSSSRPTTSPERRRALERRKERVRRAELLMAGGIARGRSTTRTPTPTPTAAKAATNPPSRSPSRSSRRSVSPLDVRAEALQKERDELLALRRERQQERRERRARRYRPLADAKLSLQPGLSHGESEPVVSPRSYYKPDSDCYAPGGASVGEESVGRGAGGDTEDTEDTTPRRSTSDGSSSSESASTQRSASLAPGEGPRDPPDTGRSSHMEQQRPTIPLLTLPDFTTLTLGAHVPLTPHIAIEDLVSSSTSGGECYFSEPEEIALWRRAPVDWANMEAVFFDPILLLTPPSSPSMVHTARSSTYSGVESDFHHISPRAGLGSEDSEEERPTWV